MRRSRHLARERGFSAAELCGERIGRWREKKNANRPSAVSNWQFCDPVSRSGHVPIRNDAGEVIAFSGRVLDGDAKAAKYINSPETIKLFTKGAVLFD
jgi:DNA primase